mmetsp:Transcript_24684/g.58622  ORF Transcript_24684/g.58622 Transcript_24684/m.58622 type:complete len:222 (+) Transcript_24684:225-890(+)
MPWPKPPQPDRRQALRAQEALPPQASPLPWLWPWDWRRAASRAPSWLPRRRRFPDRPRPREASSRRRPLRLPGLPVQTPSRAWPPPAPSLLGGWQPALTQPPPRIPRAWDREWRPAPRALGPSQPSALQEPPLQPSALPRGLEVRLGAPARSLSAPSAATCRCGTRPVPVPKALAPAAALQQHLRRLSWGPSPLAPSRRRLPRWAPLLRPQLSAPDWEDPP